MQSILKSKAVDNFKRLMDIENYFRKTELQCDMNGLIGDIYECRKFLVACTLGDGALRVLEQFDSFLQCDQTNVDQRLPCN